jgi:hypothetical protein
MEARELKHIVAEAALDAATAAAIGRVQKHGYTATELHRERLTAQIRVRAPGGGDVQYFKIQVSEPI